ncbi:hypothetical protein TNCV_3526171 [Trichonephila clavipes]|nr:hypothetical protein TNCV_3526171 [Trichonephila clavipes]
MPLGLGSNPGEGMDVCKCIVPSRHGGCKSSREVGGRGREVGGPCPPGCSPSRLGWNQAKSYCHLNGAHG